MKSTSLILNSFEMKKQHATINLGKSATDTRKETVQTALVKLPFSFINLLASRKMMALL